LLLLGLAVLAGCGGDDEPSGSTGTTTEERATSATAPGTAAGTAPEAPPPGSTPDQPPPTSTTTTEPERETELPPDDEGGDEEPARSEVVLNASRSGVRPRQVGVAPYISVKVTLLSRDGSSHTLVLGGERLTVGGSRRSAFVVLPGLRPQKSVTGVFDGRVRVRIFGSAEPGP
jgi:hypothetical protein